MVSTRGLWVEDTLGATDTPSTPPRYPEGVVLSWTLRQILQSWKDSIHDRNTTTAPHHRLDCRCGTGGQCGLMRGQDQDATNAPRTDMDGVAVTAGANQPAEVNEVDLHFVAMMTPHHQQAVDMSEIILTAEGTSAATADLADRIKVGQQEEIDSMVGWAEQWDQHDLMAHHAPHIANGM